MYDRRHILGGAALLAGGITTCGALRAQAVASPSAGRARPFRVAIVQDKLKDIGDRLASHRWPKAPVDAGWRYGMDPAFLRRLVDHWRTRYDWRRSEAAMNALAPQFLANIGGQDLHFYVQRSPHPGAIPLLLVHGWPYSAWSLREVIGPLADPQRFGAPAGSQAFDVVLPSIPGFAFSEAPPAPIGLRAISGRMHALMTEVLGYPRYIAAGGDFGSVIGSWLAFDRPAAVIGLWQDMPGQLHAGTAPGSPVTPPPPTAAEAAFAKADAARFWREFGYFHLQVTRPQTISAAIGESAVGQAAWIVEKYHSWTDQRRHAFEDVWSMDDLLDDVMLYVATDSFATALWPYFGFSLPGEMPELPQGKRIEIPVAIASANDPLSPMPPREMMARSRANIVQWTDYPEGGHFLFHEARDRYLADLRSFGARLRSRSG